MSINKKLPLFFLSMFFLSSLFARDGKNIQYGKISPADFNIAAPKFDSGANAVIIADIGTVSFDLRGWVIFTHFMRVKIINRNGFSIGNQQISLYHNSTSGYEKIFSLKGSTYNLENGQMMESKLDEKSVFMQKYTDNVDVAKFSMPGLKEGSVFELEYVVRSPYGYNLKPWEFQGEYPRLWSEYITTTPNYYHFAIRMQGDTHFYIDSTNERQKTKMSHNPFYHRWVKTDVPSLKQEPFTINLDNFNTKVTFQIEYIILGNSEERQYIRATWDDLAKSLMTNVGFGFALTAENLWISEELKNIVQPNDTEEEKTYKIYSFIRDHFKCDRVWGLYRNNTLKEVFRKKEGSVQEINMLLVAMLGRAGVKADPLIMSTTEYGIANPMYPLTEEYNYVICVAYPGGNEVTLDASERRLGFGQLPLHCYNGYGHIINEIRSTSILFTPDSLDENTVTKIMIGTGDSALFSGNVMNILGKITSHQVRDEIAASSLKSYKQKLIEKNEASLDVDNINVDAVEQLDKPMTVRYDFNIKNLSSHADVIYFNPMMNGGYGANPFKSTDRRHPVEMPYRIDDTYILSMDIPAGYQIDEFPKSERIVFNDDEGVFEYLIEKGEDNIQMQVKLKLNKAYFPVEEYGTLRDFFTYVIKKESEQIVFKKKK